MKILNFGSCNIDYVYSLDHIVREGETETTYSLELFPGGKGLNQSIAAAKAGAEVYHAGCVGEGSDMLTDVLKENGVDISLLSYTTEKNGHAIIQLSKAGDNSIFLYPGSNQMITKEFVDSVLENFGSGDIILLQNEINNMEYIVKKAYGKGMCIVLNPSPFNEVIGKIDFNMLSYLILNEVEAKDISGSDEPTESLMYFKNKYPHLNVLLTLGKKGSVFISGATQLHQPAYKVDAVDTTAAGDTFTGYFVAGLAKGDDIKDILRIASAASAIAVTRKGASSSVPQRAEVESALASSLLGKTSGRLEFLEEQVEAYIEKNIKSANINEFSELLGYSAVYTGSLIKKVTGKPFSALLQDKRCRVAAQMLSGTDLPVKEIISNVGYENESFFREKFKEVYGVSPLAYRKSGHKKGRQESYE